MAYVTDIEATFTPVFGTMLNNEATLFRGGADRVASLFLWHFTEEIEYRSSALGIYDTVVGRKWYRLSVLPKVMRHVTALMKTILDDFVEHVPAGDRGPVSGAPLSFKSAVFRDIPRVAMVTMLSRLALSQHPFIAPNASPSPNSLPSGTAPKPRGVTSPSGTPRRQPRSRASIHLWARHVCGAYLVPSTRAIRGR